MNDRDNTQLIQAKENALKVHFAHFCMHAKHFKENGDHDFTVDHRWTNSAGDVRFFASRLQNNQAYICTSDVFNCWVRYSMGD
jgi:hypothetical protein